MAERTAGEIILRGISASPGICIGKAYLVDKEGVDVIEKYSITRGKLQAEVKRFKAAVKKARDDIRGIIEHSPEEFQHTHILETHLALLKDKMFYGKTIDTIEKEGINAEWALKKVVSALKSIFRDMTDAYLKERSEDIVHVSDCIMRNLVGAESENIAAIDKRVILVAHDLSPADTSQINLERIMGFITDRGGKASHTGIIAQALEIPAVLGVGNATAKIANDDLIIVDGSAGKVIIHPGDQALIDYEEKKERYERHKAVITRESHLKAKTEDGIHLEVMGNIELPEEVFSVINYGGDGIGQRPGDLEHIGSRVGHDHDALTLLHPQGLANGHVRSPGQAPHLPSQRAAPVARRLLRISSSPDSGGRLALLRGGHRLSPPLPARHSPAAGGGFENPSGAGFRRPQSLSCRA